MDRPTIAFIGLGVMGRSMAWHLIQAGYPLIVFNRTRARADEILGLGAEWAGSPGDAARAAQVCITMVGYPRDVEDIYLGAAGIVEQAAPGSLLIDMTTSTPSLARNIALAAEARGSQALDAPVSGGDVGAREARLTIMVGGEQHAFQRALPLFHAMGKTINLMGPAGAGQHTKMCNQIAIASGMLGLCEALAYARAAGLDQTGMIDTISTGAAASWSLSNYGPRIIKGDFAPGFYVKHFIKDMEIAVQSARELGIDAPGLQLALQRYRELAERGGGELGTQALYQLYS